MSGGLSSYLGHCQLWKGYILVPWESVMQIFLGAALDVDSLKHFLKCLRWITPVIIKVICINNKNNISQKCLNVPSLVATLSQLYAPQGYAYCSYHLRHMPSIESYRHA